MRISLIAVVCLISYSILAVTIHEAVPNRDIATINQLLQDNPSLLDSQDANGNTPLHLALRDTIPDVAIAILNHNPRLDIRNNNGVLPIHLAARIQNLQLIQRMISMGADIRATDTRLGGNALHWAAEGGNLEAISFLIDQGLDPNQDSNDQWKPVDKAASRGHLDALKLLIQKGAKFPELNNPEDYFFLVAINSGNADLVNYLIDKGFDPNLKTSAGDLAVNQPIFWNKPAILKLLVQKGARINGVFDRYNFSPMHVAAFRGSVEMAQTLLDNGAEIDIARPDDGASPLQFAISMKKNEMAKFLISKGANLNFTDMAGVTPFNVAIIWENNEMALYLMDRGVDYTGADCIATASCPNPAYPPLHNAAIRNAEMVSVLLDKGVDINLLNADGDTALITSVFGDSLAPMQVLVNRKADLNHQNKRGLSALMLACQAKNVSKAKLLIDAGCEINLNDINGKNAMHFAAIRGNAELVNLLLSKGSKFNTKDKDKLTPLDYAMQYVQVEVIDILRGKGAKSKFKQPVQAQNRIEFTGDKNVTGVWYLEHSGMAVRNNNNLLIFDYWKQSPPPANASLYNGWITPDEIKDLNVYVFVSHSDMDHYDKRILEWQTFVPNLKYVFGFRPEATQDYRQNSYPLPEYVYVAKDSSCVLDGMHIKTLSSPIDDGSGFYVEINGLKLFHSGDAVNQSKTLPSDYSRSVDHLAVPTGGLDIAFLPMQGCGMNDADALKLGNDYFIHKTTPGVIIPMHSGGSEYKYDDWAKETKARGITNKINVFHNPGDHLKVLN